MQILNPLFEQYEVIGGLIWPNDGPFEEVLSTKTTIGKGVLYYDVGCCW